MLIGMPLRFDDRFLSSPQKPKNNSFYLNPNRQAIAFDKSIFGKGRKNTDN